MNSYEMRQEARRQRLLSLADRLESEGNARYKHARELASIIPMGQPILVGHHSEGRDRRFRAKLHDKFGRAFEDMRKAEAMRRKAASVGTGGISSDDPEAVVKLRAELAGLEAMQEFMKKANTVIRAFHKAGVRNADSGELWGKYLAKLRELRPSISDSSAQKLLEPDFCGRIGFADYQLQNNGANVRRIKARIEQLSAKAKAVEALAAEGITERVHETEGYKVRENLELNRVQLLFPGKPSEKVRAVLKSHGFRWSPTEGAWQRHLNDAIVWSAKQGPIASAIKGAM